MLNYIWFGMLVFGVIVGVINGRVDEITKAFMDSSKNAITLSIELAGVMCLWTGLMNIAEKGGLIKSIAKFIRPVMVLLFPQIPKKHPAIGAIVMNLVANFFGLGNAATPLGLKAMKEMQKLNGEKEVATNSMCMFLVLNTASIQLIPATIIAVRAAANSVNPTSIIGTIWFASICSTITGVLAVKLFEYGRK